MRSEGFPFNCGGLGAGGVFTRCFGPRPREDSMAGPLGNGAEGGPGGGKKGEGCRRGSKGGEGGWGWQGHSGSRIVLFLAWFLTWFLTWFLVVFASPLNGSERFRTVQGYSALKKA